MFNNISKKVKRETILFILYKFTFVSIGIGQFYSMYRKKSCRSFNMYFLFY